MYAIPLVNGVSVTIRWKNFVGYVKYRNRIDRIARPERLAGCTKTRPDCRYVPRAGLGIDRGFNDPKLHDELVASYEAVIPQVAAAGLTNLICFSGKRKWTD